MAVLQLFEPMFEATVLGAGNKPVLVAFAADWCPHCQALKPQLAALDGQFSRRGVGTWLVNVDTLMRPELQAMAGQGVPTLMAFHRAQPVWRQTGAPPPEILARMYEDLAARAGASAKMGFYA